MPILTLFLPRKALWRLFIAWKVLALLLLFPAMTAESQDGSGLMVSRRFKVTAYCSCKICCGRHSPQRGGPGLTALGNHPVAFKTVAVGDPLLLGRWILLEDVGWVYATDTGVPCGTRLAKRYGCVDANQLDLYIGGSHMHRHAARLGVQEWQGKYHPLPLEARRR